MITKESLKSDFCLSNIKSEQYFDALLEIGVKDLPEDTGWGASCVVLLYYDHVVKIVDNRYVYVRFLAYMSENKNNPYVPETKIIYEGEEFFIVKQERCVVKEEEKTTKKIKKIYETTERFIRDELKEIEDDKLIEFLTELEKFTRFHHYVDDKPNNFGYIGEQLKMFDAFHL